MSRALLALASTAWVPMASLPSLGAPTASSVSPQNVGANTRIAIAPISYSNAIPEYTRSAVHAVVAEAVQGIARDALLLDVDAECRMRDCALRQARDADAEFLLELRLAFDERDYVIEIVLIATKDGRQLAKTNEPCKLCGQAELLAVIAAQVAPLKQLLERAQEPPGLHVEGQPTDARAVRDREPMDRRLATATTPKSAIEIGGWVGFTLGIAGAGTGAALIAIDGHEHGPTCGTEVRDINGACPNVYTTELAGVVAVSLAGVALATGVGLLIASATKRRRRAAARIGPAPGGLGLQF